MKFTLPLVSFIKHLSQVSGVAGAPGGKDDITQNVLISIKNNELTFKCTVYSIEMSVVIPGVADVESEGATTVNAAKLRDSCKNLDQSALVTFDYDESNEILLVSSGTAQFQIRTRNVLEFPTFEHEDVEQRIVLKQNQLKAIIDKSIFCISNEDFREYLKGMRFEVDGENVSVFTSDGHRMAVIETTLDAPISQPLGSNLTRRCAAELTKILKDSDEPVELAFTKNSVSTSCNGYTLTSKLLICGYPNVRAVIPKSIDVSVEVPRAELKNAISRVNVLSSKRVNAVNLVFADDRLNLKTENSEHEVATESLNISYNLNPIDMSLNAGYVTEVLNAISTDNVRFCFANPIVSTLIEACSNDYEYGVRTRYIISRVVV